jgi:molybdopterin-guanine dinucleotide biosynthesis protein A
VTGVRVVADLPGAEGPAAGLVAALLAAKTQWLLLVACDQCELTAEALQPLLAGRPEARCYSVAGHIEPVPMVCSQRLTQRWDEALQKKPGAGLKELLGLAPLETLPGAADALRSVNSEADLIELGVERVTVVP